MTTSENQRKLIYIANATTSGLSLSGCCFILLMFISFKDLRKSGFKLIFILGIFDILNCISLLIPTYHTSNGNFDCQTQAILLNFSSFCGVLWTTIIALCLKKVIVENQSSINGLISKSLCITVFLGLVCTIIPWVLDAYGTTAGWCWIKLSKSTSEWVILRICLFFIPLLVSIAVNFYFYANVKKVLYLMTTSQEQKKINMKLYRKLNLYPFILILCYFPYIIKQGLEITSLNQEIYEFPFTMAVGVLRAGHGLLNCLIYGFTGKVRGKIRLILENFKILKKQQKLIEDTRKSSSTAIQ
ncbi:hypothetical protein SteCoe_26302 [Stentor coeruleus]|uniref:G-protein coupled receptors family 2 profile 2 domain-containing protein n=1 Tax=Stentor coeruleus TaxID=5963 RepID=A0A1R2BD83_9CILI|nr:hypothetical protein SteCoe_26302 [Stentor coeruleus]